MPVIKFLSLFQDQPQRCYTRRNIRMNWGKKNMRKSLTLLTAVLSMGLLLGGCGKQSQKNQTKAESTSLASKQHLSNFQLQQKYVALTDAAMKPVNLINQQTDSSNQKLSASLTSTKQKVQKIQKELRANQNNPKLTKSLQHYAKTILTLVSSVGSSNNNSYSTSFTKLNTEAHDIAKTDFNNEIPDSLQNSLNYQAENNTYASGNIINTKGFRITFTKIQIVSDDSNGKVVLFNYTYHNKHKTATTPQTDLNKYGVFQQNGVDLSTGTPASSYISSNSNYSTAAQQATTAVEPGKTVTAVASIELKDDKAAVNYEGNNPSTHKSIGTITIKLQ